MDCVQGVAVVNDLLHRAAANCAGVYREWAARTGHPVALWSDLSVGDLGVGNAAPVDSASLLVPVDSLADLHDAVDRAEELFAGSKGGPIQFWSAWPTPDLTVRGYRRFTVPGMVRPAGGDPPALPVGLSVNPARSLADFADASRIVDEVFDCGAPDPEGLVSASLLAEDFEVYVGRVDGQAVATATAYVSDGFCGVYAVATASEARGHGYGSAMSWAATMFRPDLPATLQASPMGYPLYLEMGYREFGRFDLWVGPRPTRRR